MNNEIIPTGGGMSMQIRQEIDIQIATAHAYPRSVTKCLDTALSIATVSPEVAETMGYAIPRGGKTITGPSVRLAEIVATSWMNLRYGTQVIDIDRVNGFVVAEGFCHDLESNVAVRMEARRRITNKQGTLYNDDMIQTTAQAACSVALRNALFRVVPRALVESIYQQAMAVAYGKAYALEEKRRNAINYFKGLGVTEDRILAVLGRPSVDQVTREDMKVLTGFKQVLDDGESTILDLFPMVDDGEAEEPEAAQSGQSDLDKLKAKTVAAMGGEGGAQEPSPEQTKEPPAEEPAAPVVRRRKNEIQYNGELIKTAGITEGSYLLITLEVEKRNGGHECLEKYLTGLNLSQTHLTFLREEEAAPILSELRTLALKPTETAPIETFEPEATQTAEPASEAGSEEQVARTDLGDKPSVECPDMDGDEAYLEHCETCAKAESCQPYQNTKETE